MRGTRESLGRGARQWGRGWVNARGVIPTTPPGGCCIPAPLAASSRSRSSDPSSSASRAKPRREVQISIPSEPDPIAECAPREAGSQNGPAIAATDTHRNLGNPLCPIHTAKLHSRYAVVPGYDFSASPPGVGPSSPSTPSAPQRGAPPTAPLDHHYESNYPLNCVLRGRRLAVSDPLSWETDSVSTRT